MEIGERWGYRARSIDPLVEVEVRKFGSQKPARVLVRFIGERFEGREEWVPPVRLKVLWEDVPEFAAREARWDRVNTHPGLRETAEESAIHEVFHLLIDDSLADIDYRRPGVASVKDVPDLARYLRFDEAASGRRPSRSRTPAH